MLNGELYLRADDTIKTLLDESIRRGNNFYCYQLPQSNRITLCREAIVIPGLSERGGFVVSSFNNEYTLTLHPKADLEFEDSLFSENLQENCPLCSAMLPSTTREEHRKGVEAIISSLRRNGFGKCVLSRRISGELTKTIPDIFVELCKKYPTAFIFLYNTPASGIWLGATPELLLKAEDGKLTSVSLAGTRPNGTAAEWDAKNREEQDIVTQYIADTLAKNDIEPRIGPLFTRQAGPVEHLCRIINGDTEDITISSIRSLLHTLSPTPALGGYPKKLALGLIQTHESHSRECYGGYCGPFQDKDNFNLYVNLRSARVYPECGVYAQYVGGGITRFSNAEDEWKETEIKASTLKL
ncbi:MAG: hypothetical protein HDS74_07625 [Bacteroidales bacterium]|nr:hypothetical protein [Bacteroidales bacterium]